ncbi:acyltransferase [Stenotrophomonas rhizophila]|uniref:acyltransferase n=1 Tax=Stenotrophomonas rhizophila TaxID=216778 RepID=UPI001375ED38|nr:acyltransferase [Stenotrophomonas rhizophila]
MRNLYWDVWKGLAIVAVVAIHACGSALAFPDGSANHTFGIVLRQFINFPVALFVFLSGMFALQGAAPRSWVAGIQSRVRRLLVPYLVWAAVYTCAKALTGKLVVADLPEMLATGTVISVGYYVIVMLQIAVLSPVLERLSSNALKLAIPVLIVVSFTFTYGIRASEIDGVWSQFPYNALPFFLWLPFYLAGLAFGRNGSAVSFGSWQLWLALALLSAAASVAEAFVWIPGAVDLAISQLKLSSMITSLCVCALAIALARTWTRLSGWRWALSWLGARSFYFYLSHMLVLGVVQAGLRRIPGIEAVQPAFVSAAVIITIALCAAGAVAFEFLVKGHRNALRWVGIA